MKGLVFLLLLAVAACALAGQTQDGDFTKLQIGVKVRSTRGAVPLAMCFSADYTMQHRPDECERKSKSGDTLSMHYTV